MRVEKKACCFLIIFCLLVLSDRADAMDARELVVAAFNYMRGKASVSTVEMIIHRPDWERRMAIKAWTQGNKDSIFVITAPPKDNGNGTLKRGREMWMFNPKINRTIKLPPSMMSQSWMGSDFSNNDLSKSDSLITEYHHTITGTENRAGKKVYLVESIPKPEAPVVWGKQVLVIRDDYIILSQAFFDEDFKPVKTLSTGKIRMFGGKLFPTEWKMQKFDTDDEYTLLKYKTLAFKDRLPKRLFTLTNLKNPRR